MDESMHVLVPRAALLAFQAASPAALTFVQVDARPPFLLPSFTHT